MAKGKGRKTRKEKGRAALYWLGQISRSVGRVAE